MKSGTQTTEFWTAVVPLAASLTQSDGQNQQLLIIVGGSLAALYIISRTLLKLKEKDRKSTRLNSSHT